MSVSEEIEFLFREKWCQEVERYSVAYEFWCTSVDILDTYEREIFVAGFRRLDFSCYGITGLQRMLFDLILRYIDVIWRVQIIIVRRTKESISLRENVQNSGRLYNAFKFYYRLRRTLFLLLLFLLFLLLRARLIIVIGSLIV